MAYDFDSKELGSILGSNMRSAKDYKESFITTEDSSNLQLVNIDSLNITGSYFIKVQNIVSSSTWGISVWSTMSSVSMWSSSNISSSSLFTSGLL